MPQGSGQTTKKVVKWCVRELPGYSLEFPKAFLMAATKFIFIFLEHAPPLRNGDQINAKLTE